MSTGRALQFDQSTEPEACNGHDYSISVVIVTYNRFDLLKECIEHAEHQTYKPRRIIIVDNCSTDGTGEWLDDTYGENPGFVIRHMSENAGGAGGFHTGLVEAMRSDTDWFMLIDDDAILDYHCLEEMVSVMSRTQEEAYATVVMVKGDISLPHRLISINTPVKESEYQKDSFCCNIASFCGLLLSRKIVEKSGYPVAEYFIWCDDTEYTMRIRQKTEIRVCCSAYLDHKTKVQKSNDSHKIVVWKDYYGIRNYTDVLIRYKLWGLLVKNTCRESYRAVRRLFLSIREGKSCLVEAKIIMAGLHDGIFHKLGKNPLYLP